MGAMASEIGQIPMSPALGATLTRASDIAAGAGAPEVTLDHVLAALCEDADAIAILDANSVDAERVRVQLQAAQIGASDGRHGEGYGSLVVSQDVRRILEASAAAARGSRRREINGAIVLAAIIGDGRSRAAELLQANGLTFDSAVRALQSTMAHTGSADRPPVADDVLARARERVQSRAAPSLRDIIKDMPRPAPPPPAAAPPLSNPAPMPAGPSEGWVAARGAGAPAPIPAPAPQPAPPAGPSAREVDAPAAPSETSNKAAQARSAPVTPMPDAGMRADEERAPSPERSTAAAPGSVTPPGEPQYRPAPPAPPDMLPPFNTPLGSGRIGPEPSLPGPVAGEPGAAFPGYPGVPEFRRPQPGPVLPPPIPVPGGAPPGAGLAPATGPMAPLGHGYPSSEGTGFPGPLMPPMARPDGPPPAAQTEHRERKKKKKSQKGDMGVLVETVPRAMRVGRTERAEVRIAKGAVKGLTEGMEGSAVHQHEVALTRAMSVRMRAPDGGFFIESASPETQWIENALGYASDDYASWRFLITPQERGRARLQIVVSARTIGSDGVAAESALPDQIVEVKVRSNLKRAFTRTLGWTIAAVVGGALSTFGQTAYQMAQTLIAKIPH